MTQIQTQNLTATAGRLNNRKNCTTYYDVKHCAKRICINQGGSRSGKTYSIIQVISEWCFLNRNANWIFTFVRKTLPSLKGSAYRDFLQILNKEDWYRKINLNKSDLTYNLFGNLIEFISIDQPQKIRGRKRNVVFINEANELTWEDFFQLNIRTTKKIIIDYNPSDEFHWIHEKLAIRKDVDFFVTNYTDNPHLEKELVNEIEMLRDADEEYWKIYGLGQKGVSKDIIYTHYQLCDTLPDKGEVFYGQDFGYNNPSAMVKVEYYEGALYVEEVLYQTKLTTNDLAEKYKELDISFSDEIYCDSAEPKTIEELSRAGYNVKQSNKDVTEGIRKIKSLKLFITKNSANLLKEIRSYKWKRDERNEKNNDVPIKFNDHALDAMRYAAYTKLSKAQFITQW